MSEPIIRRDVVVGVAAHRPYRMPGDPAYLPLQVGAALHPGACPGFQPDDEGDSISALNASYSELTGLYWLWKNVDAGVKGLVHYRRLLGSADPSRRRARDPFGRVATGEELESLVRRSGAVLARRRNYCIETVYGHYGHTFDAAHLDACRGVLADMCPGCLPAWDRRMRARGAHICNMLAMRADLFDAYCAWLFPVLDELVGRVSSEGMTPFEARWPGRVSERLLDPWLDANGLGFAELPVVSPEPVDWNAKIRGFLSAKFLGKKYKSSF